MDLRDLTIAYERKMKGRAVKSRRFQASLLTYLTCDPLWDLGHAGKALRPIWITYVASHEMARAFTANLRGGRKAEVSGFGDDVLEVPKERARRTAGSASAQPVVRR